MFRIVLAHWSHNEKLEIKSPLSVKWELLACEHNVNYRTFVHQSVGKPVLSYILTLYTVPIPKIISAKNARAWVSMDFI